jgi:protein-disulfide isomerase
MKQLQQFLKTPQGKTTGGLVLIIVALLAYYFYAVGTGKVEPVGEVTISDTDHVRGSPTATVTLVEFADFQCPACYSYEPLVNQVLADNPTTVKLVFRHFPLTAIHPNALLAAKASEAAALQGKFWEMHDMIYAGQKDWSAGFSARDFFVKYAKELGLDEAKFTSDLASPAIEAKILAEYQEGVRLGVQGTPTFFLNGKKIQNPKSLEEFNALIQSIGAK